MSMLPIILATIVKTQSEQEMDFGYAGLMKRTDVQPARQLKFYPTYISQEKEFPGEYEARNDERKGENNY